jgi:hypothetical protein
MQRLLARGGCKTTVISDQRSEGKKQENGVLPRRTPGEFLIGGQTAAYGRAENAAILGPPPFQLNENSVARFIWRR